MPVLELKTEIHAPLERVFDLARSIDLHAASMSKHREKAIAGVTCGLIGADETVTWSARHFYVTFRLTSKITAFEPPRHFRDEMVRGPFRRFSHDHFFERAGGGTFMRDVFDYTSPCGFLGRWVDALILERHMLRLLQARNAELKRVAEAETIRGAISLT